GRQQQDRPQRDDQQPRDSRSQGRARAGQPLTGKIVKVEDEQLIVSLDTGEQRTFRIPTDARLRLDGDKTDLKSLKTGMQVSITTRPDNPDVVTDVEANKGTGSEPQGQQKKPISPQRE